MQRNESGAAGLAIVADIRLVNQTNGYLYSCSAVGNVPSRTSLQ